MSIERVKEQFAAEGIADRILELEESSATVELAAAALQCDPDQIAKTLSFAGQEGAILIVASGCARIHNGKFKRTFGVKASMLKGEQVEELTGHAPGGVCPFANPESARVYLDVSLKKHPYVYPACGSSNSAVRMNLEELEQYSDSQGWVDVTKE